MIHSSLSSLVDENLGEGSFQNGILALTGKTNRIQQNELIRANQCSTLIRFVIIQLILHKRIKQLEAVAKPLIETYAEQRSKITREDVHKLSSCLQRLIRSFIFRIGDKRLKGQPPNGASHSNHFLHWAPSEEVEQAEKEAFYSELKSFLLKLNQRTQELRNISIPTMKEYLKFANEFISDFQDQIPHIRDLRDNLIMNILTFFYRKIQFQVESPQFDVEVNQRFLSKLEEALSNFSPL